MAFLHDFKYALKTLVRSKEIMFWTLCFPIILGTMFQLVIGSIYEKVEQLNHIPVAVVGETENPYFEAMLEGVSSGEESMLSEPVTCTLEEAEELLDKGEIEGFYRIGDEISLTVKENGMEETVLSVLLEYYIKMESAITDVVENHPEKLAGVIEAISQETYSCKEVNRVSGNMDNNVQYFYAAFAMTCLFSCFTGIFRTMSSCADLSTVGKRRGVSPANKLRVAFAEFFASLFVHTIVNVIFWIYLQMVLDVEIGTKVLPILLLLICGSACGIGLGMCIGAITGMKLDTKIGIGVGVSLVLSSLSGLMASDIKTLIDTHCPIVNKLNPAALIVDGFSALNLFDTYDRYFLNVGILAAMAILFCVIAGLKIRRTQYAEL